MYILRLILIKIFIIVLEFLFVNLGETNRLIFQFRIFTNEIKRLIEKMISTSDTVSEYI